MYKQLIHFSVGVLCLLTPGLTTLAQTGLQAFQLSGWGYPTGYTEPARTLSFDQSAGAAGQQSVFHIKSRFPALPFLVARTNGTDFTTVPRHNFYQQSLTLEDFGLYLSYKSSGNLYFRGLVGGPLYANTNGLQNYFHNGHSVDLEYRGAIGLRLGERGTFNLELEFLGGRLTGASNIISIGARYHF